MGMNISASKKSSILMGMTSCSLRAFEKRQNFFYFYILYSFRTAIHQGNRISKVMKKYLYPFLFYLQLFCTLLQNPEIIMILIIIKGLILNCNKIIQLSILKMMLQSSGYCLSYEYFFLKKIHFEMRKNIILQLIAYFVSTSKTLQKILFVQIK